MDPFTALIVAGLVTWGTVGSGIKDTAAIARGQAPPSHAYRMAKLEQQAAGGAGGRNKQQVVKPVRYRRITLADLAVHWWEDGLEAADAWRERRHDAAPERRAKRKAFLQGKKDLVKKGYGLLKERGKERLDRRKNQNQQEPEAGAESEETPSDALPFGDYSDNVVPLRPHSNNTDTDTDTKEDLPMELQLGDKNTYAGHRDGLIKYHNYFKQVADRIEQVAARAYEQEMSQTTVSKGNTAMQACGAVAAKASACARSLEQAHQSVAEQRAATGNRSDADYLTTS